METYGQVGIIHTLRSRRITLFTIADFARLINIKQKQTLYKQLQRLTQKNVIKRLTKGVYVFSFSSVDDYTIANFFCRPSYVSLESALSLHGIMTGFPYQITSITTGKPRTYTVDGKEFAYSHISPRFFWGYEKKDRYLVAQKEKALVDYLYYYSKGLRSQIWDELDVSGIDQKKLREYVSRFHNEAMKQAMRHII